VLFAEAGRFRHSQQDLAVAARVAAKDRLGHVVDPLRRESYFLDVVIFDGRLVQRNHLRAEQASVLAAHLTVVALQHHDPDFSGPIQAASVLLGRENERRGRLDFPFLFSGHGDTAGEKRNHHPQDQAELAHLAPPHFSSDWMYFNIQADRRSTGVPPVHRHPW